MSATPQPAPARTLRGMNPLYPWSDGKPLAENSEQYRWIVTLHGGVEELFADRPDVWVAADNLIYPTEGRPDVCQAPDVYVAFGVSKEDRGSFLVWEEGVFPQVVFEVRSPSNRASQMAKKLAFYDEHGAEEYYDFDPPRNRLRAYVRGAAGLEEVPDPKGHVSPRLGIAFDFTGGEMVVRFPDGRPFLTRQQVGEELAKARTAATAARRKAAAERRKAVAEKRKADDATQQAAAEKARADALAAKLRALGIDPDAA